MKSIDILPQFIVYMKYPRMPIKYAQDTEDKKTRVQKDLRAAPPRPAKLYFFHAIAVKW